jgi:hypothetical protein
LETYDQPNSDKLLEISRAMRTPAVSLVELLVSFFGIWMLGLLLFAASILAIGVILGFLLA